MITTVKSLLTGLKARDHDKMIWHGLVVLFFTHLGTVANALFQIVMGWTLSTKEYGKLTPMMGLIMMVALPMGVLQNTLAHRFNFAAQLIIADVDLEAMSLDRLRHNSFSSAMPRSDCCMPSDADGTLWLAQLDELD